MKRADELEVLMQKAVIRKIKWFWPWQDDREEAWLAEMSLRGFHLAQPGLFARYSFVQGRPQNYVYRLDYQDALQPKAKAEYLRLFTDAGWEYLGQMGGWQYFRKPVIPGVEGELFTDAETKIQKYNRLLVGLGMAFPSYLVVFVALWGVWPEWFMWLNVALILVLAVGWGVMELKISQRIKQLKAL